MAVNEKLYVSLPNPEGDLDGQGAFSIPAREVKTLVAAPERGCAIFVHGVNMPFRTSASREEVEKLLGWEPVAFEKKTIIH